MATKHTAATRATQRAWAALLAALADKHPVDLSWITPRPTKDGWTLAPDALELLTRLVPALSPRHIVEFGAGLSTRVLTRAGGALTSRLAISSLDHDPEFGPAAMGPVNEMIDAARGDARPPTQRSRVSVRFQLAPVVVRDCGGKLLPVYHWDKRRLASKRPADLILIDGPPINLGPREGVFYQALEIARPGTLVLLDDANRPSEQMAVRHWQETLGERIEARAIPGFAHGLVAVVIHEPLNREQLWAERARRSLAELLRIVPERGRVVLADYECWGKDWLPGRSCESFLGYPPGTDAEAIARFDGMRGAADFWVITWPSFWWLDYYWEFFRHVRETGRVVVEHDRLFVVDLRNSEGSLTRRGNDTTPASPANGAGEATSRG